MSILVNTSCCGKILYVDVQLPYHRDIRDSELKQKQKQSRAINPKYSI